jgi:hypothetical protein
MQETSWLADYLLAFQEGLYTAELAMSANVHAKY